MSSQGILNKKSVIQFFGFALILAQVSNLFTDVASLVPQTSLWSLSLFAKIIFSRTLANQILTIASLAIGIQLLRGRAAAWNYVLGLLGFHILYQFLRFGQILNGDKLSGLFLFVNIAVFSFIARHMWKSNEVPQRTAAKPKLAVHRKPVKVFRKVSSKKIMARFSEVGKWAQLVSVSEDEIKFKSIAVPPSEIKTRVIEIKLNSELNFFIRFKSQMGDLYTFEFCDNSSSQKNGLNQWLKAQVA